MATQRNRNSLTGLLKKHVHSGLQTHKILADLKESIPFLKNDDKFTGRPSFAGGFLDADVNRETLSGNVDLGSRTDPAQVHNLDPGGAARTVTLQSASKGDRWVFANRADAAEDLTIEDASNSTIVTVNQGDVAVVKYDGTGFIAFAVAGAVT